MLPSDMNLKIRSGTVGYNNKILVSDVEFSLGKNDEVNAGSAKSEEETTTKQKMTTIHKVVTKAPQPQHQRRKQLSLMKMIKLLLFFTRAGGFTVWYMFR